MKLIILFIILLETFLIAAFLLAPEFALADAHVCGPDEVCLRNPLAPPPHTSGEGLHIDSPGEVVVKGFQGFAAIIGLVAIAFTVFSGFKLIVASNEESIKEAKAAITWSVGGFVTALLSFTLIAATAKFIGFEPSLVQNYDIINNPLKISQGDPREFVDVMNFVMINFLGLVGFATTLMIIYYGYRYLTAAGNEEAVEQAKGGLKWAVLGLVVVLLAFTIITAVRQYLVFGAPQ